MNVAKWLLLALLSWPLSELVAFIAVGASIGFAWAFGLVLLTSVAGMMLLRHGGGRHISRVRGALRQGSFTTLQADGPGGAILLAGILLAIPGFISDFLALLILIGPVRRAFFDLIRRSAPKPRDGVVDLEPEQWRRVPDPTLPGRRRDEDPR